MYYVEACVSGYYHGEQAVRNDWLRGVLSLRKNIHLISLFCWVLFISMFEEMFESIV